MKLKNTFVQSKMNKDIDERLLPKGQYPHAENVRVANTDGSDAGAIENVKGNEKLTNLGLTNASTIGAFTDGSNQKIYWFVTSEEKDLVLEYDVFNSQLYTLLESSNPNGVLNFDKNYLITGVSKIINGESDRDLLLWTDDLNEPRKINITRSKTYAPDGFIEEDISVIKNPPRYAPKTTLTFTSSTLENNIEGRFLSFAYRYKYLDGEYSALSSFTPYNFAPQEFSLDFQTLENSGMVNAFNAVKIEFETSNERVTDIDIVFKESGSNNVYVIESYNKKNEGWDDDETRSYIFSNSKIYGVLPEDEIFRTYDNVPRAAKAMDIVGNRVVYGNYLEGYDLTNCYGQEVNIDLDLSLISKDLSGETVPSELTSGDDSIIIDLTGLELVSNSRLTFSFVLDETTYDDGTYENLFDFILNNSFADATELAQDPDFILFVETIMTNNFNQGYTAVPPDDSEVLSINPFVISSFTANTITIKAPSIVYQIDNTPADVSDTDFTNATSLWVYNNRSEIYYRKIAIDSSLKTNRSYEVGIIYMDKNSRATTVLTDDTNTLYIPQSFSVNQNKLVVNINHLAPCWADRYKFAVKQNKTDYQTIYGVTFYEEGLYRWVKLDGANKDKVKEGDTLIVKSDLSGVVGEVIKVRVLEVANKEYNFLEGNINAAGQSILEEAGLYMKIKPVGFDMNYNNNTFLNYDKYAAVKSGRPSVFMGTNTTFNGFGAGFTTTGSLAGFLNTTTNLYEDYPITSGSTISVSFRNYESDGYDERYNKNFVVQSNYDNFQDWWEAEVVNLGASSGAFSYTFIRDAQNALSMKVEGSESGAKYERSKLSCQINIVLVEGLLIFETEAQDSNNEIYYETSQVFDIIEGYHTANVQNQSATIPTGIVELDFFNCFIQGNGAESYRHLDAFNSKAMSIDLRPTSTSLEGYKETRRYADLTYSEVYNENNNVNGINEFNLARANYKEDIDKKYGFIQKLFSRNTDVLVFQEDKVSKVLYGKDVLMNADGTSNVSSIADVLGQQIAYMGEYGISRNPESFAYDGFHIYFTDAKRGAVMKLTNNGLSEISMLGMTNYFREQYKDSIDNRKYGAYDPFFDQYLIHNSTDTSVVPLNMLCSSSVVRNDFTGSFIIDIDYGFLTGEAGITFSSNGVPLSYTLEWDNNVVSSGFVGDVSYNQELSDLGFGTVVGSGNGTLVFDKTGSLPRTARLTIFTPICGANFNLSGQCVNADDITVISVIVNDDDDEGLTIKNRYNWTNSTYVNPFKTYGSVFEQGLIDTYDVNSGEEGSQNRPLTGSSVQIQSYKGYTETAKFDNCNKLGYLISDVLYTEAQISDLLDNAVYPTVTETTLVTGDIINSINFDYLRPSGEQYLYLIWDYVDKKPTALDDYISTQKGTSVTYEVRVNDTDPQGEPLNVTIINPPVNGTVVVNANGTITYQHNDNEEVTDQFTYIVNSGECDSDPATVFIDIAVSCDDNFSYSGNSDPFSVNISFGTALGEAGIVYEAFNIPDQFEIFYDGALVATTGGLVSGSAPLTFNKTTAFPTVATIVVTPNLDSGTAWNFAGLCPAANAGARQAFLEQENNNKQISE